MATNTKEPITIDQEKIYTDRENEELSRIEEAEIVKFLKENGAISGLAISLN